MITIIIIIMIIIIIIVIVMIVTMIIIITMIHEELLIGPGVARGAQGGRAQADVFMHPLLCLVLFGLGVLGRLGLLGFRVLGFEGF